MPFTATGSMYTENFVKSARVVLEISERTDRQTDTLIAVLRADTERAK